jgi:hypothetical protein
MSEEAAEPVDEQPEAQSGGDPEAAGDDLVSAVDDRAAQLTGASGAAATDSPVPDNSGPVADAEAHLEETNLAEDREVLKKLQRQM